VTKLLKLVKDPKFPRQTKPQLSLLKQKFGHESRKGPEAKTDGLTD